VADCSLIDAEEYDALHFLWAKKKYKRQVMAGLSQASSQQVSVHIRLWQDIC